MMFKKIIPIFLASFIALSLLLQWFYKRQVELRKENDARQTHIIQENVKDRFKLFLDLPLSIGLIGAGYFSTGNILTKDYSPFAQDLQQTNKEVIGLNLMDQKGMIIRVYPQELNPHATGKISQNINLLQESWKRGEKYWFSPPFKLYQGTQGFAFYVPIVEKAQLKGWLAIVISTQLFLEKFKLSEFLKTYELIIKDQESGYPYFATAMVPETPLKVYESTAVLHGRKILFISWSKEQSHDKQFPWYWNFLIALIPALGIAFAVKLFDQKKKARAQLRDISAILRFTSKEALVNLIDAHNENHKSISDKGKLTYMTNLIEQIDLLQTMAHADEELQCEHHTFLPMLEYQLENLYEIIEKKNVIINYNAAELGKVSVFGNSCLIQNSVLCNILIHLIVYSEQGGSIHVGHKASDTSHFFTFHAHKITPMDTTGRDFKLDRRMEVARQALRLYQGELYLQKDLREGMIIHLVLPITE